MMRSMFAGVTGLRNHQIRLDVIGNNIANVNTVGFKASRVNFQEVFSQTFRGASSPQNERGGTNPQQVGLGMSVSSIDNLQTQGNLQTTGKMTDLAIQGNGFFMLGAGGYQAFTRAGAFDLDADGFLVDPASGLKVQGWLSTNGTFPVKDVNNCSSIQIPVGTIITAKASTKINYAYNLDCRSASGAQFVTSVDVFDSQGKAHSLTLTFTKGATANTWNWEASGPTGLAGNTGGLTFDDKGVMATSTGGPMVFTPAGAQQVSVTPDFKKVTQFSASSTVSATSRDGYPMGSLESFTVDSTGTVTGVYSNGLTQKIAQVATATFANPGGMVKRGENLYEQSNNSGIKHVGEASTSGRGAIAPGALEMSNVDLSQEFTNMIITQRGFQANSRIITTSDEMLQELVNLKR
jgi:flagellar hook protein FlgE